HVARRATRYRESIRTPHAGIEGVDGSAHRRRDRWLRSASRRVYHEAAGMDPVIALRQIAYYRDRKRDDPRRVMAYRNAADIIEGLAEADRERHGASNSR